MPILVLLRGNSGSGKTTVAKALQKKIGHGTMLLSQDVVRREMLHVKDGINPAAQDLILELALYGKKHCEVVILEGILHAAWYRLLFDELSKEFNGGILAYYFDLPFEETLLRHQQKTNLVDFGEKEMRKWWKERDTLELIPEVLLSKDLTLNESVEMIYQDIITAKNNRSVTVACTIL